MIQVQAGKAAPNSLHRIFGMNLIFEIDEAFVLRCDKGLKHLAHGKDAVSHTNLTVLSLEVGEVLHVDVMQPCACFVNSLNPVLLEPLSGNPPTAIATQRRLESLHSARRLQG